MASELLRLKIDDLRPEADRVYLETDTTSHFGKEVVHARQVNLKPISSNDQMGFFIAMYSLICCSEEPRIS
jgi:hypothetical protein